MNHEAVLTVIGEMRQQIAEQHAQLVAVTAENQRLSALAAKHAADEHADNHPPAPNSAHAEFGARLSETTLRVSCA